MLLNCFLMYDHVKTEAQSATKKQLPCKRQQRVDKRQTAPPTQPRRWCLPVSLQSHRANTPGSSSACWGWPAWGKDPTPAGSRVTNLWWEIKTGEDIFGKWICKNPQEFLYEFHKHLWLIWKEPTTTAFHCPAPTMTLKTTIVLLQNTRPFFCRCGLSACIAILDGKTRQVTKLLNYPNRSQINAANKKWNDMKTIWSKCATCGWQTQSDAWLLQPTSPSSFVQSFGADVDQQKDGQGILGDGVGSCRPTSTVWVGIKGQNRDAAVPLADTQKVGKYLQRFVFTHAIPRSRTVRKT